jgi:hypothetical protein
MLANSTWTRRTITMNYNRPEIVKLADAVDAIQGMTKVQLTNDHSEDLTAAGAYEADE